MSKQEQRWRVQFRQAFRGSVLEPPPKRFRAHLPPHDETNRTRRLYRVLRVGRRIILRCTSVFRPLRRAGLCVALPARVPCECGHDDGAAVRITWALCCLYSTSPVAVAPNRTSVATATVTVQHHHFSRRGRGGTVVSGVLARDF